MNFFIVLTIKRQTSISLCVTLVTSSFKSCSIILSFENIICFIALFNCPILRREISSLSGDFSLSKRLNGEESFGGNWPHDIPVTPIIQPTLVSSEANEITHDYFWGKVQQYILPNSIVIAETGTSLFGVYNMKETKGVTYISQLLWCSIGYSVGATLGASIAARQRQVYLFVGDGSFQLTAQEISVMIRNGLTPIVFILNNDGYLTEKLIRGPYRSYNNFQMWEYSQSLKYFGGHLENNQSEGKQPSSIGVEAKVSTPKEFEDTMETVNQQPNKIHLLEIIMPQFDAPGVLKILVEHLK